MFFHLVHYEQRQACLSDRGQIAWPIKTSFFINYESLTVGVRHFFAEQRRRAKK